MEKVLFYKNKEYTDLLAIQDTAKEVQNLKQKGIQVIGIFMGSARSGEVAGKIFWAKSDKDSKYQ